MGCNDRPASEVLRRANLYFQDSNTALARGLNRVEERVAKHDISAGRVLDVVAGTMGLALMCSVAPLIGGAIYLEDGGNPFFQQLRVGKYGTEFMIYKFRTMKPQYDGHTQGDECADNRVTKIGGWLRKTKLDELPQFWNVVRGDMSLVGPRPIVVEDVEKCRQLTSAAHCERWRRSVERVRPGLTGLNQIHSRGREFDCSRIVRDRVQVTHSSLGNTAYVIWKTIEKYTKLESLCAGLDHVYGVAWNTIDGLKQKERNRDPAEDVAGVWQ